MRIAFEIIGLVAKLFSIFKKKKRKKRTSKILLLAVALLSAVITALVIFFVPTIIRVDRGGKVDAFGHLSHLKIRKKPKKNGKMKTAISYDLIDIDRYVGDEE